MHFGKSTSPLIYIRWTHRAITKLPFNKLRPFLFSLIFLLLCYRSTSVKKVSTKYKHSTTQLSPVYHHCQFQHLIIQTQNQTKNNSKSTQNNLKSINPIGKPIPNPTQNQPKTKSIQNQTQNQNQIPTHWWQRLKGSEN